MRAICLVLAVAVLAAGCSGERIVTTDEPRVTIPTTTTPPPPLPPPARAHLVSSFDYVLHPQGDAVYYFTSPSGRWSCAILPRDRAGCQSSAGGQFVGVTGAPDSVLDAEGEQVAPNAIVVDRDGDARFVAVRSDDFVSEDAKVLPFNRILAVAGFRCNVQEDSGVSCASERTGKGFSFAADGFVPRYTEVPAGAP